MFSKSKLLAAFLLSVSTCGAALAQTTTTITPGAQGRLAQIFTDGGGSYLGVQSEEVTKENFSKFGLRDVRGVAVQKVMENSPAAQAGLQNNDVIVRFDSEEVTSVRKLTRLIGEVAPDHQVRLTVLRNGSEREITATLGKRPAPKFEEGAFSTTIPSMPRVPLGEMPQIAPFPNGGGTMVFPPNANGGGNFYMFGNSRQIGVSVSSLNKQLGDYFGVADGKGVLINSVVENSAAAKAGLKAGDVIVEVDGKAVDGNLDLTRAINEKKEGEITLTIIRNKNRQTVRVTPEKGKDNGLFEIYRQENGAAAPSFQPRNQFRVITPTSPRGFRVQVAPRTL
jgi:membrane-associated protease RseP (regulator of RpoE activity)